MASAETEPAKPSMKGPLIFGLLLALTGAAGGFFLSSNNMLPFFSAPNSGVQDPVATLQAAPSVIGQAIPESPSFVSVPPLLISLGLASSSRHLRFAATLEAAPGTAEHVEAVMPRIIDVLNGYLRAVETADFDDPAILTRLRKQMLRRVQLVTEPGQISDLLISEFVLD